MLQIDQRQIDVRLRRDDLHGLAIDVGESGTERFVAVRDGEEAAAEGIDVERALPADCFGNVVERAMRHEPIEQPEALLGKGGRRHPAAHADQ